MNIQKSKIVSVSQITSTEQYIYDIEMSNSPHTFFANDILVHNSIFMGLKLMSDQFLQKQTKQFDSWYLQNVVKKYNTNINKEYYIMELQHQKTFTHLYFGQGKKRYYAIMADGSKYIKGLNVIRKDCPVFMRSKLNQLAQLTVRQLMMIEHLQQAKQLIINAPYNQIGVYKRFTKKFQQYSSGYQTVVAAKYANENYGTKITNDDVVFLFNIITLHQDHLKLKDRHNAICLLEQDLHIIDQNKDKFIIDYDTYFDKQCIHPLEQFKFIDSSKWIIENYKKQHRDFYPFKPSMTCPVCQKKHSKLLPAKKCCTKFITKLKKQNNITDEQKIIITKIKQYLKHFQE